MAKRAKVASQELELLKEAGPGPVMVAPDPFLSLIERLSLDERIDPVKLGQIFDLKRGLEADRSKAEYQRDFAAMSAELPVITKKGKIKNKAGQVQSQYARYEDIQRIVKPILRKHGFTLNHEQSPDSGLEMILTTFLIHRGGHSQRSTFRAKADTSGSKNDVQGLGSIAQYAKRYNVSALLDLETQGEDDDAQTARVKSDPVETIKRTTTANIERLQEQAGGVVTQQQRDQLARIAVKHGRPPAEVSLWLKRVYRVKSSKDLPVLKFAEVKAALEAPGPLRMPGDGE